MNQTVFQLILYRLRLRNLECEMTIDRYLLRTTEMKV